VLGSAFFLALKLELKVTLLSRHIIEKFLYQEMLFFMRTPFCQVSNEVAEKDLDHDGTFLERMYNYTHDVNQDTIQNGNVDDNTHSENAENLRHSTRIHKAPTFLEDYHQLQMSLFDESLQKSNKVHHPLNFVLSYEKLLNKQLNYTFSLASQTKPQSYKATQNS